MTTYIHSKSAFMKLDDVRLATRKRSEARLKRYSSVSNACIWAHHGFEKKKYIFDMMGECVPKKSGLIGHYIPVEIIWKILSVHQNETIACWKEKSACYVNLFRILTFSDSQINRIKQLLHTHAFTLIQSTSLERICEENVCACNHIGVQVKPKTTHTLSVTENCSESVAICTDTPVMKDAHSHMDISSMMHPDVGTSTERKSGINCSIQVTPESPLKVSKSVMVKFSKGAVNQSRAESKCVVDKQSEGFTQDSTIPQAKLSISGELVTVLSECNQTSLVQTPPSVIQLFKSSNPSSIASIAKPMSDASNGRQSASDSLSSNADVEDVYVQECGIQCSVCDKASFLHNIMSNIKNCVSRQFSSPASSLVSQGTSTLSFSDISTNTESGQQDLDENLMGTKCSETINKAILQIEVIESKLQTKKGKRMLNVATKTEATEMISIMTKTSHDLKEQLQELQKYAQELKNAETCTAVRKQLEYSEIQIMTIPDGRNMNTMQLELEDLQAQVMQMTSISEECDTLKELVRCLQNDLALYNNVKAEFAPLQFEVIDPETSTMLQIQDILEQIAELKHKAEQSDALEQQLEKERHDAFVAIENLRRVSSSRKSKEIDTLHLERNRLQLKIVELEAKVREKELIAQKLIADADEGFKEDLSFASEQADEIEVLTKEKESLLTALVSKECELAEQEEQIERLVVHVDRLTTHNEQQEEKSHKLFAQMRAQLEAKQSYIAKMDAELQYVEERLKTSISTICRDSSELQQKVISLECACRKYEAQISEMETGRRLMEKQLHMQDELNKNYSKELQQKQHTIQQLVGEDGEPHYQQKLEKVNKMEDILRKSHNAMRKVIEELSKKYTEEVVGV